MSVAPDEGSFRRGPRSQIALLERKLRGHRFLAADDHVIEWRQGWIRRWRVDGVEQPVPAFDLIRRAVTVGGMSSFSYSSRAVFLHFGSTFLAADLALLRRLEAIGGRTVCMIYSSAPPGLGSVQWTIGELEENDAQLAGLASRVLARQDSRLSEMGPEARRQISGELADLEAFGVIEAEFARASAQPDAPSTPSYRQDGPATVIGRFLQALIAGDVAERRRLQGQLNGGRPGWNHDEAALVQAASGLAARRLWRHGDRDARDISDTVSFLRQANQSRGRTPHGQAEMEAVVRSALGDTSADTTDIIPTVVFEIQGAVTAYAALKLRWPPPLTDALLAQAEQIVFERGWKPPLAT